MYSALIGRFANEDPPAAALLLESVVDPDKRVVAARQLVSVWARVDAEAAERWTRNLPQGRERENAIMALTSEWDELDPSRRRLIDEIDDPELRKHTVFSIAFRTAHANPEEAERILRSFDLPDAEREQLLQRLEDIRNRSLTVYPGF